MRRASFVGGAIAVLACLSRPAWADDATRERKVAVVVVNAGGSPPEDARGALERRLGRTAERAIASLDEQGARLEAFGRSVDSREPSPSKSLASLRQTLLEAVAFGRDDETIRRGQELLATEEPRLPSVNRADESARALADVCWFVVRALEHGGDIAGASAQARTCLHAVPDVEPSPSVHPPELVALAVTERKNAGGSLRVRSPDGSSSACVVRVQGRPFGAPPALVPLVAGDYAVELDCGRRHRVHGVTVQRGVTTELGISERLDASLSEVPPVRVDLAEGAATLTVSEARILGAALQVDELWMLQSERSRLSVRRVVLGAKTEDIGSVRLSQSAGAALDAELERAERELRCRTDACASKEPPKRARSVEPGVSALGVTGAAMGLVAVAGSWAAYARYQTLDSEMRAFPPYDPRHTSAYESRNDVRTGALATSIGGSTLLVASEPLLLPGSRGVPAWAWSVGGVGLGLAGLGVGLWSTPGSPEKAACSAGIECHPRGSRVPLAPMLLSQGAALMSVPFVYLIRSVTRHDGTLSVGADPQSVTVSWVQPWPEL